MTGTRGARGPSLVPLLGALGAVLLASGCDAPTRPVEPPREDAAAQIAAERRAEDEVADQVTLARLSREVAELHVEVDALKASRQALDAEVIDRRLRALERGPADAAAITPSGVTPGVTAGPTAALPPAALPARPRPTSRTTPAPKGGDGGR